METNATPGAAPPPRLAASPVGALLNPNRGSVHFHASTAVGSVAGQHAIGSVQISQASSRRATSLGPASTGAIHAHCLPANLRPRLRTRCLPPTMGAVEYGIFR